MVNQLSDSEIIKQKIQTDEQESADEFELLDVIKFIKRNFFTLLWGMLLGVIIAGLLVMLLPKEYEATALVKIGEIGNTNSAGSLIEPTLQVLDRIKSLSFQDDVLEALKVSTEDDDDALVKQFRKSLKVKLEKSDLITLSVRALSRTEATKRMQEVVNQLNAAHNRMSYPTISRLKLELESVNNELKLADIEAKRFAKTLDMQSENVTDLKFSQAVLLSNMSMSKAQEYRTFRDNKRMLEEKLSPERTFPTHVLGRVEVSKKAVFPKYSLFMAAGLMLGFFASWLFIFARGLKVKLALNQ